MDEYDQDSNVEVSEEDFGSNIFLKINSLSSEFDELGINFFKDTTEIARRDGKAFYNFDFYKKYLTAYPLKKRKKIKSSMFDYFMRIFEDDLEIEESIFGYDEGGEDLDDDIGEVVEESYLHYFEEETIFDKDDELYNLYLEFDEENIVEKWEGDDEQFLSEDFSYTTDYTTVGKEPLLYETEYNLFNIFNHNLELLNIQDNYFSNFKNLTEVDLSTPLVFDQFFDLYKTQDYNLLEYHLNLEGFFITTIPFLTEKADDDYDEIYYKDKLDIKEMIEEKAYNESTLEKLLIRDHYRLLDFDLDYKLAEIDGEFEDGDLYYNFLDFRITGLEINLFKESNNNLFKAVNFERIFLFKDQRENLFFDLEYELPNREPDFVEYYREIYTTDIFLSEEYIEDSSLELSFFSLFKNFGDSFFGKKNFYIQKEILKKKLKEFLLDTESYNIYKIFLVDNFLNSDILYFKKVFFYEEFFSKMLLKKKEIFFLLFFKLYYKFYSAMRIRLYKLKKKINKRVIRKQIFNYFFFYNWYNLNMEKKIFDQISPLNFNLQKLKFNGSLEFFYQNFLKKNLNYNLWEKYFLQLNNFIYKNRNLSFNFSKNFQYLFLYNNWKKSFSNLDLFSRRILKGGKNSFNIIFSEKKKNLKLLKKQYQKKFSSKLFSKNINNFIQNKYFLKKKRIFIQQIFLFFF